MWTCTVVSDSAASPATVYQLLSDVTTWPRWNPGVKRIDLDGALVTGIRARMVFPDDTALPFEITWAEDDAGYEDLTPLPDPGVVVRVLHRLTPTSNGTTITYIRTVEPTAGDIDDDICALVGRGVSEDFGEVIDGLSRAAEPREREGACE